MGSLGDLHRLKREYSIRESKLFDSDIYSLFNDGHLFFIQNRQREIIRLIRRYKPSKDVRILEVGCGAGEILSEFISFGYSPRKIFGVDVLQARLINAQKWLSIPNLICGDGQLIPCESKLFDLVLQFTAFSSILDDQLKINMADEILRVLKPDGTIMWYDFWLNPTNPQTRGIRPAEIRKLFPNCDYEFLKITLAPPIARKLVPVSWMLALLLEKLKILNSHYLVAIHQK